MQIVEVHKDKDEDEDRDGVEIKFKLAIHFSSVYFPILSKINTNEQTHKYIV